MFPNIFRESDSAAARLKHQIDTLKIFNDNVTEVVKDEEYKIDFGTGGRSVSLIVKLGPDFPVEKPTLFIYPAVRHQWVSQSGEIVSAPGLLNYTMHSDLGRVVKAIIREFELRPPQLLNGDISPPQDSTSQKQHINCQQYNDRNYNINDLSNYYSVTFPALNELSTAQLKELYENSELLNSFIETLNIKSSISERMDELIDTNEKLAKENLEKEPEIIQLQEDIASLSLTLKEYKTKYEELSCMYKECCDKFSPHRIIEKIRHSVTEVDEESEKIAESFLTGQLELDSFLFKYVSHRQISHARKVKDDKLSQQLEKLHQLSLICDEN